MKCLDALGFVCIPLALALTAGCAVHEAGEGPGGDPETGVAVSGMTAENALSYNALSYNALSYNALSYNALSYNVLSAEALDALLDPGAAGDLFRVLVKYTVSCALSASQSFSFSWIDGEGVLREEVYPGQHGLAEAWAWGPLDQGGRERVSGCLAARTNRYGVSVQISMRSHERALRHEIGPGELEEYPHVEGAFWGDLFTATPYLRACYTEANVANSRAAQRDCAAGQVDPAGGILPCGMIEIVGSCDDLCSTLHPPGQYYRDCDDPDHGRIRSSMTTALP